MASTYGRSQMPQNPNKDPHAKWARGLERIFSRWKVCLLEVQDYVKAARNEVQAAGEVRLQIEQGQIENTGTSDLLLLAVDRLPA